eukprot:gnl/TRDRNA2_/TRDRNA2_172715_c0_seq2.p3 gnl/TRDRNA2_/TRDRNA2_172715_c0~~gnl/TRDRNA2_/TRDRNA2_172715_c0_seq2.p3  ORF type:complete len:132 (-),score=36.79 gnl/TRDRNA2_/TRDRNA2_172715_c0_seq2:47-442(-)
MEALWEEGQKLSGDYPDPEDFAPPDHEQALLQHRATSMQHDREDNRTRKLRKVVENVVAWFKAKNPQKPVNELTAAWVKQEAKDAAKIIDNKGQNVKWALAAKIYSDDKRAELVQKHLAQGLSKDPAADVE